MVSILLWFFVVLVALAIVGNWMMIDEPRKPVTVETATFNSILKIILIALLAYAAVKL